MSTYKIVIIIYIICLERVKIMVFYNIHNMTRDISLSVLVVIIFISLQFVISYLYQWYKSPYRRFSDFKFTWSVFLMSVIVNIFFHTLGDFYSFGQARSTLISIGAALLLAGLAVFTLAQEFAISSLYRYAFSAIGFISAIFIVFRPFPEIAYLSYIVIAFLYSGIFILFSVYVWKRSIGPFRIHSVSFILGLIAGIIGYLFIQETVVSIFGYVIYPIGAFLILVGIVVASLSIGAIPPIEELGWDKKIKEIYLIHESGMPLFHIDFTKKEDLSLYSSEVLKSGAITSINMILKAITRSKKKIQTIDQGDLKLLFGHKGSLILVVVSEEDLRILHYKIKQFFKEFLAIYGTIPTKVYNRKIFLPARALALRIFTKRIEKGS